MLQHIASRYSNIFPSYILSGLMILMMLSSTSIYLGGFPLLLIHCLLLLPFFVESCVGSLLCYTVLGDLTLTFRFILSSSSKLHINKVKPFEL